MNRRSLAPSFGTGLLYKPPHIELWQALAFFKRTSAATSQETHGTIAGIPEGQGGEDRNKDQRLQEVNDRINEMQVLYPPPPLPVRKLPPFFCNDTGRALCRL